MKAHRFSPWSLLALLVMAFLGSHGARADTSVPNPPQNVRVRANALAPSEFRFASVQLLINERCLSCHRPGGSATDFTSLTSEYSWVTNGYVVPGEPLSSLLFRYLQGSGFSPAPLGTMPVGGTLSSAELDVFREWIHQMSSTPPTPTPTGSPVATPTNPSNGMTVLLPMDAVPRLGARFFVKAILDQVFGAEAQPITQAEVAFYLSVFGGVCDQMGQPPVTGQGEDICSGVDVSIFAAPTVPVSSSSRRGRTILVCNRLLFNQTTLENAIRGATQLANLSYLNSNPLPTAAQLASAYALFHPGETAPPQVVISALQQVAQAAQEANRPFDPWRYALLALCYDPSWQVK